MTSCGLYLRFDMSQNLFVHIVDFSRYLKQPTLERVYGLFNLRQSTMAAASAARTALYDRFGFSETGLLASVVGAGSLTLSAQVL